MTRATFTLLGAGLMSLLVGTWFGEGLGGVNGLVAAPSLAILVAVISVVFDWQSVWRTVGIFALALGASLAGWCMGSWEATAAYNACLTDGRSVLTALHQAKGTTGAFPESLSELPGRPPCRRWLRGTLLQYERRNSGFSLRFSDWLVSHSANETSKGFRAAQ